MANLKKPSSFPNLPTALDGTEELYTQNPTGDFKFTTQDVADFANKLVEWTIATRPTTPVVGQEGYNTDLNVYEYWNGTAWVSSDDFVNAQRAWVKEGQNDAHNTDSVGVNDNKFTKGKVNVGADFTAMPADDDFDLQVNSGLKVTGGGSEFQRVYNTQDIVYIYIDPIVGTDLITNYDDRANNPSLPFWSLNGAFAWIQQSNVGFVDVYLVNSSLSTPVVCNVGARLDCKTNVRIKNGFISVSSEMVIVNSHIIFSSNTITSSTNICTLFLSEAIFENCTINSSYYNSVDGGLLFNAIYQSRIEFSKNGTINFLGGAGNKQAFLGGGTPNAAQLCFSGRGLITITTAGADINIYTPLNLSAGTTQMPIYIADDETKVNFGPLNLQNAIIMRGTGISLRGFSATDYSVGLAEHSDKPFYTPNMPTYADNTAAWAGELVAGMWYKTAAGDIKIVI